MSLSGTLPTDNLLRDNVMQPFQLESSLLRGRLIRLGSALDIILHQHNYPKPVATLLGESVVMAAALSASLKYEGVFTFQVKGDGAVRMLVADVTHDGGLRAYARFDGEAITVEDDPAKLLGKGFLAFTVDQQVGEDRYQGVVELQRGGLSAAVQHYFRQSEQIPTGIVAAVRQDAHGRWQGGCLMLQRMPSSGGIGGSATESMPGDSILDDDWHRAMMLMGTCGMAELTDPMLAPNELLYRLFHEEGVRVYEPHAYRHQCRCSETRVIGMLRALPQDEVEELTVDGVVTVTCEFCNKSYPFDKAKREQILLQKS